MATLQAATASNGAVVTDPDAVNKLCEDYDFGNLNWEITDDNTFVLWGYGALNIYEVDEHGDRVPATREFLSELANYIGPDEKLDIQSAGFTKCRFPVHAQRYVIQNGKVLNTDLGDGLSPIKQTSPLNCVRIPFDSILAGTAAEGKEITDIEWTTSGDLEIEYR